jgi:hypothetical protein
VSNLVKGLADTGFVKEDLSEDCRESLLKEVLRVWNQMNAEESRMSVLGYRAIVCLSVSFLLLYP